MQYCFSFVEIKNSILKEKKVKKLHFLLFFLP